MCMQVKKRTPTLCYAGTESSRGVPSRTYMRTLASISLFCLLRHATIILSLKLSKPAVRPNCVRSVVSMLGSLVVQAVTNWCLASSQSGGRKIQDRSILGIAVSVVLPATEACTLPVLGEPYPWLSSSNKRSLHI